MTHRTLTSAAPLTTRSRRIWSALQWAVVLATIALIAGFFTRPDEVLDLFWFVLIPFLPATFLLNAGLWRGVCPLATLNVLVPTARGATLTRPWITPSAVIGITLLFIMVPARHLIFNGSGMWLGVTILAVALVSLGMGFLVRAKGGFCNSICPVLPVEKLYGQSPLVSVRNPRCVPCSLCTVKGCLDIDPSISVRTALGNGSGVRQWIRTPFGVFAAAFPGFILGYFQVPDLPLSQWYVVYGTIFAFALGSLIGCAVLAALLRIPTFRLMPFLGALAVGIYYWYAAPASLEAYNLPGGVVVRWVLLAFVAFWLVNALKRSTGQDAPQRPVAAHPVARRFPMGSPPR